MKRLDVAIMLAVSAHAGRVDKAGLPEILHPLEVMIRLKDKGEDAMIVGVLHDTVEDGLLDGTRISSLFGEYVLEAVMSVTRRQVYGLKPKEPFPTQPSSNFHLRKEKYLDEFIPRAKKHPIGRMVKKADLEANIARAGTLPPAERDMVHRWERALEILQD